MSRRIAVVLMSLVATVALAPAAHAANLTCVPTTGGGQLTPEKNLIVTKVTTSDYAYGQLSCVSTSNATYTATLTLTLEVFRGGTWVACNTISETATAIEGVAATRPEPITCTYPDMIGVEYHRFRYVVTTSLDSGTREGYSATWATQPG